MAFTLIRFAYWLHRNGCACESRASTLEEIFLPEKICSKILEEMVKLSKFGEKKCKKAVKV